jgi:hypothetical protein
MNEEGDEEAGWNTLAMYAGVLALSEATLAGTKGGMNTSPQSVNDAPSVLLLHNLGMRYFESRESICRSIHERKSRHYRHHPHHRTYKSSPQTKVNAIPNALLMQIDAYVQ